MSRLSILLLGDADRSEFLDARSCLDRWGTVDEFAEVAAAETALADGRIAPEVIVVAQAFPGQFSHRAIDGLRRLAPLARVVGLMGSWCEGEMRSGSPWPGAARTYWHQWAARCNRQLGRLSQGKRCYWALPPTATEEERLLVDNASTGVAVELPPQRDVELPPQRDVELPPQRNVELPFQRGLVVIFAESRTMAEWLSAACRSRGFATVWQRTSLHAQVEGATAAIFDAANLGPEQCRQLHCLAESLQPAPVLVLLAFPRIEDRRLALSAGAAAMLSKPLAVEDLFAELEAVASGQWIVASG